MPEKVNVIGAGLAGREACWQLIRKGISVRLYEMRPVKETGAHKTADFSELVCSNSLRSNMLTNAVGLLKQEMRELDSLIMKAADKHALPAGSALAVDREGFAREITEFIKNSPLVEVINEEVTEIPEGPTIIATGPLTSSPLAEAIKKLFNEDSFYFFDAAAPIVTKESINMDIAYFKSRYDKGDADYLNCPMTREQFDIFYNELINGETAEVHDVDKDIKYIINLSEQDAHDLISHFNGNEMYAMINLINQINNKTGYEVLLEAQSNYLLYLKHLADNNPDEAKRIATESLISAGIIDESCNLAAPYNGENVGQDDFTRGPKTLRK